MIIEKKEVIDGIEVNWYRQSHTIGWFVFYKGHKHGNYVIPTKGKGFKIFDDVIHEQLQAVKNLYDNTSA